MAKMPKIPDSGSVVVACKWPHGLILRVYKQSERLVEIKGGMAKTVDSEPDGDPVEIRGYLSPSKKVAMPARAPHYELTYGVPAAFMKRWLEQFADSDLIKNGIIGVAGSRDDIEAWIRENEKRPNGREPLDPDNLPKILGVDRFNKDAA